MKYMGSKARIAKYILPIILDGRKPGQYYVEPFAGGMNMISEVKGNRIANDYNKYLISMWVELLNGWVPQEYTKEEYLHIRANMDLYPNHEIGWVGFNCSYSGKFFGGFAGKTKTKAGVRDYQKEALNNCMGQIKKLRRVIFKNSSYFDLDIPVGSIIYCDPPYQGTTGYKIEFDHDSFWEWCRVKTLEGNQVFISEYKAPEDFICLWSKKFRSSLSANGKSGGSKNSIEKLFKFDPLLL